MATWQDVAFSHTHTNPFVSCSCSVSGLSRPDLFHFHSPSPHSVRLLLPLLLRPQLQAYLFHEPLPEICSHQFPSFLWSWSGPPHLPACFSHRLY